MSLTFGIEIEFHSGNGTGGMSHGEMEDLLQGAGLNAFSSSDPYANDSRNRERYCCQGCNGMSYERWQTWRAEPVTEATERRARPEYVNGNAVGAWTIKNDAGGWEIVSPILEGIDAVREEMAKWDAAMAALEAAGFTPNSPQGAGFHLHIGGLDTLPGARDRVRALANCGWRFAKFERYLDNLWPEYRRGNAYQYSRSIRPDRGRFSAMRTRIMEATDDYDLSDIFNTRAGRYAKLNYESLGRHGTLEVRAMHSTTSGAEILGFTAFWADFFAQAVRSRRLLALRPNTDYTDADLFRMVTRNMSGEAIAFLQSRLPGGVELAQAA